MNCISIPVNPTRMLFSGQQNSWRGIFESQRRIERASSNRYPSLNQNTAYPK